MDPFHSLELAYALEEATAKLRHDVRNKLSGMENMVFYVTKHVAKTDLVARNPVVGEFLATLDATIHEADGMLDELLSTTGPFCASSRDTAVSARSCVDQAIETRRGPSRSIQFDVRAETTDICVNPASMAIALRALVENAVECSPGDGRVAISGHSAAQGYVFDVVDHGPGMPDPVKAVTPFYSTKEGHLGLGLSIARRVLLAHEGSLTIASGSAGTTVTLVVPPAPPRDLREMGRHEPKTIFLVDDESSLRLTTSVLFEEAGFRVEVAASFAEAKEKLREAGTCDIVLLDQDLGDGSGIDLVPLLREERPSAKVVLVSGATPPGARAAHRVDAVIAKGFFFPDLLARVQELLAGGET